jgi:hypothetical protein
MGCRLSLPLGQRTQHGQRALYPHPPLGRTSLNASPFPPSLSLSLHPPGTSLLLTRQPVRRQLRERAHSHRRHPSPLLRTGNPLLFPGPRSPRRRQRHEPPLKGSAVSTAYLSYFPPTPLLLLPFFISLRAPSPVPCLSTGFRCKN